MNQDRQAQLAEQVKAIQSAAGSWSSEERQDPETEIQALRDVWAKRLEEALEESAN
jgi:hypothetical protein